MEEEIKTMMKKKTYCKPEMHVEEFTPNEYVGTCWAVKCEGGTANKVEQDLKNWHNGKVNHNGDCTKLDHQFIYDSDGDNKIDGMFEMSSDQGHLEATRYSDNTYGSQLPFSTVEVGDYIYWTTHNDTYTWHHQGYVQSNGSSNHS